MLDLATFCRYKSHFLLVESPFLVVNALFAGGQSLLFLVAENT